ncbi:MAG: hypothetical protein JXQ75_11130, partial [Phycisphaerae bacterium]|nr:hypothetical protein [Phycisphaerae bacterium]
GIGDWGLGIGDWPIVSPRSTIANKDRGGGLGPAMVWANSPWQDRGTGAKAGGFHGQERRFRTAAFPFTTGCQRSQAMVLETLVIVAS